MIRRRWLVTAVLVMGSYATAFAQAPRVERAEPVVVTATKVETRQEELGATVTVISEEETKRFNYDRIEEALRTVPGVEIIRQGGPGSTTAIQIRGMNSNRIQVLVDGMRVKSPTLGSADLAEFSLDAIDRVEVVRGPQSTLHGSDAMGGVVNIITKKGAGAPRVVTSFEGGSYETFRETVTATGALDRFNFTVAGSRFDSRGRFDPFNDTDLTAAAWRLGYDFPGKGELSFSGRWSKNRIDIPVHSTNPTVYDPNSQQQDETLLFNLAYQHQLFSWWTISGRWGQWWNNVGFQDPPPPGDAFTGDDVSTNAFANPRSQVDTRRREFELINTFTPFPWATSTIGFEHRNEFGQNRSVCSPLIGLFIVTTEPCERGTFSFRREVNTIAVFGQQDLRLFDRIFLSGGLRWDDNDQFGDEVTPRVSAAFVVKETGTKLRGAWGKGFRAPTINDLIFPGFGVSTVGPERSESYEVGFDQTLWDKRIRFGSTYFHNEFRDLIQAVCNATFTICVATNVGGARSQGLENYLEVEPLDWITAYVNYTFTDTRNTTTGEDLPRFARHRWNAGITVRPIERLTLFAQAQVVSSRFEGSFAGRNPGYYAVDVGGTFRLFGRHGRMERAELTLRIENVTNERYEEVLGYRALGPRVLAGIRVAFQ
jgi:vitamin B12 transporter